MTEQLLDAALKGTVVLSAAWIITWKLCRAPADLRHRIWLAALGAMVLLLVPVPLPEPAHITVSAGFGSALVPAGAARSVMPLAPLWLAGAALVLLRFALGMVRLTRLTGTAEPAAGLLVSDGVQSPVTWGVLRPVIVIPRYVMDWPADQRDLVIAHERAHIVRRDWFWQTVAQVVCAMFWFHPMVWLAAARLRHEAELATDDLVLSGGAQPAGYAAALVEVAKRIRGPVLPGAAVTAAITMVRSTGVSGRVGAILDASRIRSRATRAVRVAVPAAMAALVLLLAACGGARVYRIGKDVSAPVVVNKIDPDYTDEARTAKREGTVVLALVINPAGRAEQVRVVQSLDPGLDANAVEAVRNWTFRPGIKDGKAVPVAATIEVNFKRR